MSYTEHGIDRMPMPVGAIAPPPDSPSPTPDKSFVHVAAVSTPLAVTAVILLSVNLRLAFGSSSAVTSDIRAAYHLGSASTALLTTGPVICLGMFGPLAPHALQRWSAPFALTTCLGLMAVGTAARGVPSWPALLVGTLAAGAGIAVANVLAPVFIREFFPHRVGLATGLFTTLVSASAGIASGLTVPLSIAALHSWRVTLFAWTAPGFIAVAVFAALELRHRRTGVAAPAVPNIRRHRTMPVWRSSHAWAVTGFMGIQALLAYSMIAWLPTIYADRGLDAQAAALVLTALSVASILTALSVPIVAARITDQRVLAVGVVTLSAAGLIGILVSGPHFAVMWAILLGFGQGGQLSLALAMINLRTRDASTAADLSTMTQSIGYLIAALGPLITGALHGVTAGWTWPVLALAALMVPLAGCGWIAGAKRTIGDTGDEYSSARTPMGVHDAQIH